MRSASEQRSPRRVISERWGVLNGEPIADIAAFSIMPAW
jgi:hypothetical protein